MEHMELISSQGSKLFFESICCVGNRAGNRDIFEKSDFSIFLSLRQNVVKIAARFTREQRPRSDLGVENAPGQDSGDGTS